MLYPINSGMWCFNFFCIKYFPFLDFFFDWNEISSLIEMLFKMSCLIGKHQGNVNLNHNEVLAPVRMCMLSCFSYVRLCAIL